MIQNNVYGSSGQEFVLWNSDIGVGGARGKEWDSLGGSLQVTPEINMKF